MEYQEIINLLDTTFDDKYLSRFISKKWIEVHDQLGRIYNSNKQITLKTSMVQSDLCDYSDSYIVVKGTINVTDPDNDAYNKKFTLKKNTSFVSCISKIINTLINNAEDLGIVMAMYNLIEYNKNCSETTGSLWNYMNKQ